MTRRLSRCHSSMRACQPRSLVGDRSGRLPRRWRAWESTTGTTSIVRADRPSGGADPMQAAMRPVVPLSAAARMTTMTHAPVPARATIATATIVAHVPTSPALGVVHAPTGMTMPMSGATAVAPTPTRVAAAPDAAHAPHATTGKPPPDRVAAHAAPRPPTLERVIVARALR